MARMIAMLTAAALLAPPATAFAQSGEAEGCWRDSGPDVRSTVCFEPGGGGTFSLIWGVDEGSGWTEGRCAGLLQVTDSSRNNLDFEVPRQADSCIQDGELDRLARRVYDCELLGSEFMCTIHVYLDDGTEWGDPAVGVVYVRQ